MPPLPLPLLCLHCIFTSLLTKQRCELRLGHDQVENDQQQLDAAALQQLFDDLLRIAVCNYGSHLGALIPAASGKSIEPDLNGLQQHLADSGLIDGWAAVSSVQVGHAA